MTKRTKSLKHYRKPYYEVPMEIIISTIYHLNDHLQCLELYYSQLDEEVEHKPNVESDIKGLKNTLNFYDEVMEDFLEVYRIENFEE